jgi:hypothetical protein
VTFEIARASDLGRLLSALQCCLADQAVPIVTVALDEQCYVMEALS